MAERRLRPLALTQRVDHADPAHVQLEQFVVDGLASLVVHEEVVQDGAQLGRQAGQEVDHAQPCDTDLGPGDVEWQQHQEAEQWDALGEFERLQCFSNFASLVVVLFV